MAGCDIAVIGGGPVGLCFAAAAAALGQRIVLLESRAAHEDLADERTIALSWGSVLTLARLGADLRALAATTPIRTIFVSRAGDAGRTCLRAADAKVPMLGLAAPYRVIVGHLVPAAGAVCEIRYGCPVQALHPERDHVRLEIPEGSLDARLVVLADGGNALTESAGFTVSSHDYGTCAVVGQVRCDRPATDIAYERFTDGGPIALLPREGEYALIWTVAPDRATLLHQCPASAFVAALQAAFGWRAGRFRGIHARSVYALRSRRATPRAQGRIVTIGNAAQSLHPVAGQGLNLGLRDAWSLARALRGLNWDHSDPFESFVRQRERDRTVVSRFTDGLVRGFTPDDGAIALARGAVLEILDLVPAARGAFARAFAVAPTAPPSA